MILGNKILIGSALPNLPITFVGIGGFGSIASSSTVSVPYPIGVVEGDLLVASMFSYNPVGAISAPGWVLHSRSSDIYLEASFLTRTADGTESGNVTFTVDAASSRFFGIIAEYSGGYGRIASSDMTNTRKTSEADLFNNDNLPIENNSAYLACFGTTSSTIPGDVPGNYTKRVEASGSNNGIMVWDYIVNDKNTEDGNITTGTASSFCMMAGCIIE